MYLGLYRFPGDPDVLLPAYDRLVERIGRGAIVFHACVRTTDGISVYDACPSRADFEAFSTNPDVLGLMAEVGLGPPEVELLGDVHLAIPTPS